MFIDKAEISIKSGNGGNGAVSFRREKYVPNGGPDGGDGGKGGDIVFVADTGVRTLMDLRYKRKYHADNGDDGGRRKRFGKSAKDTIIKVPVGTAIFEKNSGKIMCDLNKENMRYVAAKGGHGGKGNQHFATSTRQAPTFARMGSRGKEYTVTLQLRLIADLGLIGYPNVGKSTFLSMTTKASPKIANYHFTTLSPNLGVVDVVKGKSFVIADIPGLIIGASEGVGLGFEFLRHIERTRLLAHVVDASGSEGRDPYDDFISINKELTEYSEVLADKKQIVIANKMDVLAGFSEDSPEAVNYCQFKDKIRQEGYELFEISAATGKGINELLNRVNLLLDEIESEDIFKDMEVFVEEESTKNDIIYSIDGNVYCVDGSYIDGLMYSTDMTDIESLRRFQNLLSRRGIFDELRKMGCEDGDSVRVGTVEFEFYD